MSRLYPSLSSSVAWLRSSAAIELSRLAFLALAAVGASGCLRTPDRYAASALDANVNPPANFELNGQPLCFVGSNNYYLSYQSHAMVDDVMKSSRELGFPVIRTWGFIDIGSLEGSVPHTDTDGDGTKNGFYFQYWDPKAKKVVYNDGEKGLQGLDYAVAKAGELGLKVIVVLTNNWQQFGGMDQYLAWFGRKAHHEFYTAPEVKGAFKDWVQHLVTHVNSVNGKMYRDDPAVFAWELANEPRCKGSGPGGTGWSNNTMVSWVDEMSAFIKSIDPNHMISVGDEGFINGGGDHWSYKANDGVDHAALTAVNGIDFGTYHMYPEDWGVGPYPYKWADGWIRDHERIARELGKPTVLEEYGVKVIRDDAGKILQGLDHRLPIYSRWNNLALRTGGNATMVWMLAGINDGGGVYKDYDHYTVYRGDESTHLLADFAKTFSTDAPACRVAPKESGAPSAFVRVQRPLGRVASSWSSGYGGG
jgi:mannan endo-1,4-beta-mannosidase